MTEQIYPLTTTGVKTLAEAAKKNPDIFLSADTEAIKTAAIEEIQKTGSPEESLFKDFPIQCDSSVFALLNGDAVSGPSEDEHHATFIHQGIKLSSAEMSDPKILSSINCFHAAKYAAERWKSSNTWKSEKLADRAKHVILHYLGTNKESNAIARIWWLYEFAKRTSVHSKFDTDVILKKTANNVNFYHQILRRKYLMSSDIVRAAIIDVCMESGMIDRNDTNLTSKMMQELNNKAGGISLDLLPPDILRNTIKDCIPPK